MYNLENNNNYPVEEEKYVATGELLAAITSTGDSAQNLHKVILEKSQKYHNKLKHGYNKSENDFFIYSFETGQVFYAKGIKDKNGKLIFGFQGDVIRNIKLGNVILSEVNKNRVYSQTLELQGEVLKSETVQIKLNDEKVNVTYDNATVYSSFSKNILANNIENYKSFRATINIDIEKENKLEIKTSKITKIFIIKYEKGNGYNYQKFNDNLNTRMEEEIVIPSKNGNETPTNTGTSYNVYYNGQISMRFFGDWNQSKYPYTYQKNAAIEIPFNGTGIDVYIYKHYSYSRNLEIWIDNKQYPSFGANIGSSNCIKIARNLPQGNHVLKIINKDDRMLKIGYIKVYNTATQINSPYISVRIVNGVVELNYNSNGLGMEKYIIYRSKNPNINVDTAVAYDILEKDKAITSKYFTFYSDNKILYYDTLYNHDFYYYKIVGIDGGGYKWISNEVVIKNPKPLSYYNNSIRDYNDWQFTGNWNNKNNTIPYTNELDAAVTIPFIGTGIDIYIYKNYNYSNNIEVWVDGVQYPSFSASYGSGGYVSIVKNLPYGKHTVKLVNKTNNYLRLGIIRVYMEEKELSTPTLDVKIVNGLVELKLAPTGLGMEKYYIYREKESNFDIENIKPLLTIEKEKILSTENHIYYNAGYNLIYYDTLYNADTYYYKFVGIDASGNKWVSQEKSINFPNPVVYYNTSEREDNTWNFVGNWGSKTTDYPDTYENGAYVEIPFKGTGIDVYIDKYNNYSQNIEVYVDGIQYPSFKANYGSDGYVQIARNLPYGNHILKLINKDNNRLRLGNIRVYMNVSEIIQPTLNVKEIDGMVNLTLNSNGLGMKKYIIYKDGNPYFTIEKGNSISSIKIHYNAGYNIQFYDTINDRNIHTFKIVGIDGSNNEWISQEVSIQMPSEIRYYNTTPREGNNWVFEGTWYGINGTKPYTYETNAAVTIPFTGTGIKIYRYVYYGYTEKVDVYIDGVYSHSINALNSQGGEEVLASGLNYGNHTVKLVNNDGKMFRVYYIKVNLD